MIATNLEELIPGLAELRAAERINRALAFAGLTHTVCGVEIRPLAPVHRLGLQLLRNAFIAFGAQPLRGDVFQFLWFLSPAYAAPSEGRRIRSALRQWRLRRHVRRLQLGAAVSEIRAYLVSQLQDVPEGSTTNDAEDQSPWVIWVASDASFWINIHGGFTLESYLRTPYLILQQLYRGYLCNHPKVTIDKNGEVQVEQPQFINESDRLVGQWQAGHRAAIADFMRSQTTRLP